MISYRYLKYNTTKGYSMNNTPTTYEDYIIWDNEYKMYEDMYTLRTRYIDSVDRDDMDYPPAEWDSGL